MNGVQEFVIFFSVLVWEQFLKKLSNCKMETFVYVMRKNTSMLYFKYS